MFIQKKRIVADEEIIDDTTVAEEEFDDGEGFEEEEVTEEAEVTVDPEATELLFQAEDVAELVAEVTGMPVEVTVDEDSVKFAVGDDEFTVEPEGDEEVVESAVKMPKTKKPVKASRVPVKAATTRTAKKAEPVVLRKNTKGSKK